MGTWIQGEELDCPCGNPAIVRVDDGKPYMLCIFHTDECGIMCRLPNEKPAWASDKPTREELIAALESAPEDDED